MGRIISIKDMDSTFLVSILYCLALIVVQSSSELVLLHQRDYDPWQHELTCISEDDNGAALTWNYDPLEHGTGVADFTPKRLESGKLDNCAVRNASDCLAGWNTTNHWPMENSVKEPEGPIFDHRWEGLREYNFKGPVNNQAYQNVTKVESSGSMWFSARGTNDLYVYMCKNQSAPDGPCIWVAIAGWGGTGSVIRFCASGAREPSGPKKSCADISEYHEHESNEILDLYKWRTFKIEWNSENKTIKIFKSNESEPFLIGKIPQWQEEFHVSVRGDASDRIRFHFYDYYFTETNNTVITTKEFAHSGKVFLAELLVSLCQQCKLSVRLVNKDYHNFGTWTASGVGMNNYSDLLTWQSMKLIATLDSDDLRDLKFEIRTILDGNAVTGRWAIDNFRIYESGDQTRRSSLTLTSVAEKVTCQKLSYTGLDEIVSSSVHQLGSPGVKSQLQNFIRQHKEQDIGRNGYMCNADGCTCGRGFKGYNFCPFDCDPTWYGYDCTKKCGSCQNYGNCDSTTGFCQKGCQGYKIAPFCKTDLKAPTFENIGNETVTVIQKIELDADVVNSVTVSIKELKVNPQSTGGTEPTKDIILELKRSGNSSTFKRNITGLKLSTVYVVHTNVTVTSENQSAPSTTFSPERKFATTCYGAELLGKSKFEIVPDERSFTVREWNKNCTIETSSDRNYTISVTYASTNKTVGTPDPFTSFPHTKTGLQPDTNYTVMIRDTKLDYEWILPKIRTSESAPSKVQELTTESTNTTVTVRWNPPLNPNGRVTHYSVMIKLSYFQGCKDFGEKSPSEEAIVRNVTDTTTIFENLHPYARYVVNVTAYNSKEGISDERNFDTKSNAIPTSKVRNLRFNATANRIDWDNPDCTTVTGFANVTKVLLRVVDKPWEEPRYKDVRTPFLLLNEFHLDPYTEYMVRVHVVRCVHCHENPDVYQEIPWSTKPPAPSVVRNLTVYDLDSKTVSLQWMPPELANGQLESYVISIKGKGGIEDSRIPLNVSETTYCNDRKGFLCYENLKLPSDAPNGDIQIEVFAKNKDVEEIGKPAVLKLRQEFFDQAPSDPVEVKVDASRTPGSVTLKWRRPRYSPTKISTYSVVVTFVNTSLLDNMAPKRTNPWTVPLENPNQENYTTDLSLFPSTTYNIIVKAVSQRNRSSTEVSSTYRVPGSVGFDGKLELRQESQSSIEVKVPGIINATEHTWVSITVKGTRTCVYHNSGTPPTPDEQKPWIAMRYQVNNSEAQTLSVSGNSYSDQLSNCSFRIGEHYKIVIDVVDETPKVRSMKQIQTSSDITLVSEERSRKHLAWLTILPALAVCLLVLYIRYRRRGKELRPASRASSSLEILDPALTDSTSDVHALIL